MLSTLEAFKIWPCAWSTHRITWHGRDLVYIDSIHPATFSFIMVFIMENTPHANLNRAAGVLELSILKGGQE